MKELLQRPYLELLLLLLRREARLKRARLNDVGADDGGGVVSEVTITTNHNINKNGKRSFSDQVFPDNNDDTIAGLRSQMDTTNQLIVNLQELGADEYKFQNQIL